MNAKYKPTKIDRAKTHIITEHPFYSSILLKRELVPTTTIPTAAVNAHGRIMYNPEWVETLTILQVVFLLCHECMHYMFMHMSRRMGREAIWWNWACDAVINALLITTKVGEPIPGGVYIEGAHTKNAEEVYATRPTPPPQPPGGGGEDGEPCDDGDGGEGQPGKQQQEQQPGESQPQPGQGGGMTQEEIEEILGGIGHDIDETDPLDEAELAEKEAECKVEMAQARNAAKQMGKMHASLEQLVDQLLSVKTPWYEYLERFMTRSNTNDYSWAKPDRRYLGMNCYLPDLDGTGMGEMVVISDESGSIDNAMRKYFSGHLNTLLDACQPEKLYLLHVDTRVAKVEEFEPTDYPVELRSYAGGGTDMRAGIKWVTKNHPDVDCIVVLTDGYTPFGDDPGIPTFWAITTEDMQAPWGESVFIDPSDDDC
jgi:predicted metal-dependent peptidase